MKGDDIDTACLDVVSAGLGTKMSPQHYESPQLNLASLENKRVKPSTI